MHVNYGKADGILAAMPRHWLRGDLPGDLVRLEPRSYLNPLNCLFPLSHSETAWYRRAASCCKSDMSALSVGCGGENADCTPFKFCLADMERHVGMRISQAPYDVLLSALQQTGFLELFLILGKPDNFLCDISGFPMWWFVRKLSRHEVQFTV